LSLSTTALGIGARWMLWSKDASRRWWICRYFSASSMGCGGSWCKIARRCPPRAIATCVSLLAASLLIDSQSFIGDDVLLDLAGVEARRLFQRASRWRWSLAATAGFSVQETLGIVLYISIL
jgi:hypothetical protein